MTIIDDLEANCPNYEASIKSRADGAASAAQSTALEAQHTQATVNPASALATKNKQAIEGINEKIDRMFKRSASK